MRQARVQALLRLALVVALLGALLPTSLVPVSGAAAAGGMGQTAEGATVLVLASPVEVATAAGGGRFGPARDGQSVVAGDQVRTGAGGSALVTFFDGSEVQLAAETALQISQATARQGISVFQAAGTTVTRVQQLAAGQTFTTDTPAAVALVRGTTYAVTVRPAVVPAPVSARARLTPEAFAAWQQAVNARDAAATQRLAGALQDELAPIVVPGTAGGPPPGAPGQVLLESVLPGGRPLIALPRAVPGSAYALVGETDYAERDGGLWQVRTWVDPNGGATWDTYERLGEAAALLGSAVYEETDGSVTRVRTWRDPATGGSYDTFENLGRATAVSAGQPGPLAGFGSAGDEQQQRAAALPRAQQTGPGGQPGAGGSTTVIVALDDPVQTTARATGQTTTLVGGEVFAAGSGAGQAAQSPASPPPPPGPLPPTTAPPPPSATPPVPPTANTPPPATSTPAPPFNTPPPPPAAMATPVPPTTGDSGEPPPAPSPTSTATPPATATPLPTSTALPTSTPPPTPATATPTASASATATPPPTATATTVATRAPIGVCTTNVSGTIATSQTWNEAGSPYCLSGDVTIAPGQVLTIGPRVDVRFNAAAKLIADTSGSSSASIVANGGSAVDEVRFMANTASPAVGYWAGIEVRAQCAGTSGAANQFSYVRVEYADVAIRTIDARVTVDNSTIASVNRGYVGQPGGGCGPSFPGLGGQSLTLSASSVQAVNTALADTNGWNGNASLRVVNSAITSQSGSGVTMLSSQLFIPNMSISGGSITTTPSGGSCISVSGGFGANSDMVTVDGATLTCGGSGISTGNGQSVTFRDGTITAGGEGIAVGNARITLARSTVNAVFGGLRNGGGGGAIQVDDSQITATDVEGADGISSQDTVGVFGFATPPGGTPTTRITSTGVGIRQTPSNSRPLTVQDAVINSLDRGVVKSGGGTVGITRVQITTSGSSLGVQRLGTSTDAVTITNSQITTGTGDGVTSSNAPVTFTGTAPAAGATPTARLSAGGTGIVQTGSGGITVSNATLLSGGTGVAHSGAGAVNVTDSTLAPRSGGSGLGILHSGGGNVSLSNSSISGFSGNGLQALGGTATADAGTAITGNGGNGALIGLQSVGTFAPGTYSGNGNGNDIGVQGTLAASASLQAGRLYELTADSTVASGATLTIPQGAELHLPTPNRQLTVQGGLSMSGTAVAPARLYARSSATPASTCNLEASGATYGPGSAWLPGTIARVETADATVLPGGSLDIQRGGVQASQVFLGSGRAIVVQGTLTSAAGSQPLIVYARSCTPPS